MKPMTPARYIEAWYAVGMKTAKRRPVGWLSPIRFSSITTSFSL